MVSEMASALHRAGATLIEASAEAGDDADAALARTELALGGPVDLLIHAGVSMEMQTCQTISAQQWRAGASADLDGRFLQTAAFARRCIANGRGGSILYLMPSRAMAAGRVGQASCLGALCNLIKSLAVEWARDGIRINGIASRSCEDFKLAEPKVRASLVNLSAYLLSDYAAYISGMVSGISELGAGAIGQADRS
jgi:NAD(P)-dependent dehydrogenase (short-subunit alcohol dehydrogenase family)